MITRNPAGHDTIPPCGQLPEQLQHDLLQLFKLLSDESRLRILMELARRSEMHVTALCEFTGQSQPAVSHHLALLRVAGLIQPRRDGKRNYYSIHRAHFQRVLGELILNLGDPQTQELRFDKFVLAGDGI